MNAKQTYNALILAGSHQNDKRLIRGQNKAFLQINGQPMIKTVVEKTLECPRINKIVVIGPREKLKIALQSLLDKYSRLKIIQQRTRMLENVWNGFIATFDDGNYLPVNREIDSLLLGGHLPIRKERHLYVIKSIYAAIAQQMERDQVSVLSKSAVKLAMEDRIGNFRKRFERVEMFFGRIDVGTILSMGHVLVETEKGIKFQNEYFKEYFWEWEKRLNKAIFLTACDIPLIMPHIITDFIERSEKVDGDFCFAVTTEEVMKYFSKGVDNSAGIVRPYVFLREAKIRAANLVFVRPNQIGNKELIQESFGIRKMTEIKNMSRMIWKLIKQKRRSQTLRLAIFLSAASLLDRGGFHRSVNWFRRRTRNKQVELCYSRIFQTRFKLIELPYGGVSLDIDTEEDYELLVSNYDYWLKMQEDVASKMDTDYQVFLPQNTDNSAVPSGIDISSSDD